MAKDKLYHVIRYDRWSFRKVMRVCPPVGPPGIDDWYEESRNTGTAPVAAHIFGKSLKNV